MSFTIFQSDKSPFKAIKTRSSKSRKIGIFPKGLTHGFCPKIEIFPTFLFFGNIGQENVIYDILERKNAFLTYKNKKLKKMKNWYFFKGVNPWFWSKNGQFSNFFYWELQDWKMSFTIFQSGKTPLQAIKTRSSKSGKIDIFPKGLTHGFGPKMAIFGTFLFQAIQARKMSFTKFQSEKTHFKAIKTSSPKS